MKPNRRILATARLAFPLAAISLTLSATTAHAQTHWDNNGAVANFGTAGGTWTTGGATSPGWGNAAGTGAISTVDTTTSSALTFGNATTGLLSGNITVSGTVEAGNLTFASATQNIGLLGGSITLAAASTISVNGSTTAGIATISSDLTGAATSLSKTGTGMLVLSGNNSAIANMTVSAGTLRLANTAAGPNTRVTLSSTGTALQFGTDTSTTLAAVTAGVTGATGSTIVSDRATAGAGITHYITSLSVGSGAGGAIFEKGSNVTSGQAVIEIGSVSNNSGSTATLTLNPNTANVNITGNVTLGTSNTGNGNLVLGGTGSSNSIDGVIQNGTRANSNLTKSGTSTWTLSGNNTYNGATTISGGTLIVGSGGTSGSLGGTTGVTNNAALIYNRSNALAVGYVTSGSGTVTKQGGGTLTFSANNTYSGATLVSGGTLALSGTGTVNGSNGITVNGSGAKFLQNGSVAVTPTVTLTQGTLTGSGTVNTVNVGNATGGIISNNDGVAGAALTIGTLTFNGAATVNTFSNSASAAIVTTSISTNAAGNVAINPTNSSWTNGVTYDLISFGSIGGAGVGQFVLGTIGGASLRQTPTFSNTPSTITLSFTGDTPKWTGAGDANWNLASTNNWKLVAGNTTTDFLASDDVLFDDTATVTTVTIDTANVNPTATTFNNTTKDYTLNGAFGISTGTLTKSGSGNLTINTVNTSTGATTVNGGTVVVGSGGSLGSGSALTVGASGTVDFQNAGQTLGAVSNANSLTFSASSGNVTLASLSGAGTTAFSSTGTATVTGGISGGTVTSAGALTANISGGAITVTGLTTGAISGSGTLGTGSLSSTSVTGGTNTIIGAAGITTLNGGNTTVGGVATIGTLTSGIANLNGATSSITTLNGGTVNLGTTALTVSSGTMAGDITGAGGSITKTGATGNLILSGTNTFGGNLTIDGSTSTGGTLLTVSSNTALGSTAGGTTFIGGTAGTNTMTLGNGVTVTGENLTLTSNGAKVNFTNGAGTSTWAGNVTFDAAATGSFDITTTGNLTIGANASDTFKVDSSLAPLFRGAGNHTINSTIQGGNISKTDAGVVTLTAANTHTGNTTNAGGNGGKYLLANSLALQNSTYNITNTTATANSLTFDSSVGSNAFTLGGLSSAAASGNARNFALQNTASAAIALSVGNNNQDTSYNGVMSGGGSFTKIGSGILTLTGNNSYSGGTTLNQGTLSLDTNGTLGATTGALAVNNTNTVVAGTSAILNLATAADTTVGSLSGSIATPASGTNTATINTQTGRNFTVNQTADATYAGVIAGDGDFTLGSLSTHALTLSGVNTYSGTTAVNAGALIINGNQSTAAGAISVSNTDTRLMGTGTIGGATTINAAAIHSAGNGTGVVGNQNFSSSLTFANGSIFEWDINVNDTTTGFDTVAVTGDLNGSTGGDTSIFRVVFGTTAKAGVEDSGNVFWNTASTSREWSMALLFGKDFTNGLFTSVQTYDSTGFFDVSSKGSFTITGSTLTWTAVPEPTSALAGLLLGAGLLRRRRSA
jgi:autotransporter-associated beta strand protein